MLFSDLARVRAAFEGRSVAIVGSGPGALDNNPDFVDGHDVVVRVNNYKTGPAQGYRCDVFYSFFGGSIRKTREELQADGVKLCLAKCPDAKFMESEWHRKMGKPRGVDFRYIYRDRRDWWFCPTYVPGLAEFVAVFEMLGQHIPTTGFSALHLVRSCRPASLYLTGFDFFSSRVHNVNEPWRPGNPSDPIGHAPEREREWLRSYIRPDIGPERPGDRVKLDRRLAEIMETA
jgi:hypothetical protein